MHYSRLKLKVQEPLKLKDLIYKFVVTNNITKKKTEFEGKFDEQGLTTWYEINNLNTSLNYIIKLRGEILQTISVKPHPSRKTQSTFTIKLTSEITKNVKENIKEIHLNNGEVAWYLIKKSESVMAWSQRVFKKPLTPSDWDILKTNNTHLPNLVFIGVLQPGQVIILSNTTTAKELTEYKKHAKEAQENLEKMKQDKDFDAEFFAQNYEFFYDALINDKATTATTDIFKDNEHPLVQKFESDENKSLLSLEDKRGILTYGALSFSEGATNRIYRIHGELAMKMAEERAAGSKLANAKHFDKFKQKYSKLYDELNRESTKKLFKWDQSIQTNNMRRIISQSSLARDKNYKGGIKQYAKKMSEVSKLVTKIKIGGYLFLGVDVIKAGVAINDAKPEDRAKTTVVQTATVAGGFGSGVVVSALVVGLATGGSGLVVLGIVALAGASASWAVGNLSGDVAGGIYDIVAN